MKFAMINDAKCEAQKGLSALCPSCGGPMIAKCGQKKIHHWSHKGKLKCDLWWENETQWHRDWKGHFPNKWQEVIHKDEATGEKHIADVKTDKDWILEFQHSFLQPGERKARNNFYKKIAWVVDGTRLKGDLQKVLNALNSGKPMNQLVLKISPESCSLFSEWISTHAPTFFDFGGPHLVLLLPIGPDGFFYATTAITKDNFLEIFRDGGSQRAREFEAFLRDFPQVVHNWNNPRPQPQPRQAYTIPRFQFKPQPRRRRFRRL